MMAMKCLIRLVIGLILVGILPSGHARAASSSIVIGEISMGTGSDASDEYVVWHNNSDQVVDIAGWAIQYKSATGVSWSKKATIAVGASIDAYDDYLLATKLEADAALSSGLSQAGGNLRIINAQGEVIDQLAWGNGDAPETAAAAACNPGQFLTRKINEDTLVYQDSDNNLLDFEVKDYAVPTPPQTGDQSIEPEASSTDETPPSNAANIIINELLPDPVTPLSDSSDEFIELYNAEGQAVNMKGWSLADKSGHKYVIGDVQIGAYGYVTFYSKDSKISLNNDGDEVSLLAADGSQIDVSPNYDAAKSGLSWGLVDGGWGWTVEATPGRLNSAIATTAGALTAAQANAKNKAKAAKAKPKAAAKKASSKKVASAKKVPTDKALAAATTDAIPAKVNWWTWLLIALGVGTIGYGIYEYRPEIQLLFHKLRTKLSLWRKAG